MSRFAMLIINIHCKLIKTRIFPVKLKQGYFLYLCTPVQHLLPQLSVCDFQMTSGGNELIKQLPLQFSKFKGIQSW